MSSIRTLPAIGLGDDGYPRCAFPHRLAAGTLPMRHGIAAAHPFSGQLAAIDGPSAGVDALALSVDVDPGRVP